METTKTTTEKLIDGLRKAAAELEKLQVQAALGKADAKDKYEETRKIFQGYIQDVKIRFDETKSAAKGKSRDVKPLLESLQLQFALGKAETKEVLEEQGKKFAKTLWEIENYFKKK